MRYKQAKSVFICSEEPSTSAMILVITIQVEYEEQRGNWLHYQTEQNQSDAYRVAQRRGEVDASSCLRRAASFEGLDLQLCV